MIIKDLLVVVRLNADNNNKAIQNIERVVRKNINVLSPATLVVLCNNNNRSEHSSDTEGMLYHPCCLKNVRCTSFK